MSYNLNDKGKSIRFDNKEIPIINIDYNVWIINVKNKSLKELNSNLRQACIDNNFFAMCWVSNQYEDINKKIYDNDCTLNSEVTDGTDNKAFLKTWEYLDDNDKNKVVVGAKNAFNNYSSIKKDDYVIWTFDGKYYIGKVKSPMEYFGGVKNLFDDEELSKKISMEITWGCYVDEWKKFENDTLLPSIITGRLSQQYQSTISRVENYIIRIYTKDLYDEGKILNEHKMQITKNNFAICFDYKELEDLVFLYILGQEENKNYYLLPSSCKISKEKYEFNLLSTSENEKPITCQVKNRKPLDCDNYKNGNSYERIYLFSGIGIDNTEKDYKNVIPISKEALFEFLLKNNNPVVAKLRDNLGEWYAVADEENMFDLSAKIIDFKGIENQNNDNDSRFYKYKNPIKCWKYENSYYRSWNTFYSYEFQSFVCKNGKTEKDIDTFVGYLKEKIVK